MDELRWTREEVSQHRCRQGGYIFLFYLAGQNTVPGAKVRTGGCKVRTGELLIQRSHQKILGLRKQDEDRCL